MARTRPARAVSKTPKGVIKRVAPSNKLIELIKIRNQKIMNQKIQQNRRRNARKGRSTYSQGIYQGRFNRKRATNINDEKIFGSKGMLSSVEIQGQVSDGNVCWVGHTTSMQFEVQRIFILSLYRKVLEKFSQMTLDSCQSNLGNYDVTGAILSVETADENDLFFTSTTYIVTSLDTLDSLSSPTNPVTAAILGTPATVNHTTYRFLKLSSSTVSGRYAHVDLRLMKVHYWLKSKLKVQNASQFSANDNESDDVNAVHLTGRMFKFSSANPRPRKTVRDSTTGLNVEFISDETGVNLQRGANLTSSDRAYNEVPTKEMFTNCTHVSKVNLEPGKIKSDVLYYKKSVGFQDFVKLWAEPVSVDRNMVSDVKRGPCHIVILEKQIGFGTNPINLYYEKQQNIGVYCTEGRSKAIVMDYYNRTVNKTT